MSERTWTRDRSHGGSEVYQHPDGLTLRVERLDPESDDGKAQGTVLRVTLWRDPERKVPGVLYTFVAVGDEGEPWRSVYKRLLLPLLAEVPSPKRGGQKAYVVRWHSPNGEYDRLPLQPGEPSYPTGITVTAWRGLAHRRAADAPALEAERRKLAEGADDPVDSFAADGGDL